MSEVEGLDRSSPDRSDADGELVLMMEDLMAENELLRQQRSRLMNAEGGGGGQGMQGTGGLGVGPIPVVVRSHTEWEEQEARVEGLKEALRKCEQENRRLVQEVHSTRVELLQVAPLRGKISELNTTGEHTRAKLRHASAEQTQSRKDLQQAQRQGTISASKQAELKARVESLLGLSNKADVDRKALRLSLHDSQQELQNKEEWWHKRLEDDVLAVSVERDSWQERALGLAVSLRKARAQLKSERQATHPPPRDRQNQHRHKPLHNPTMSTSTTTTSPDVETTDGDEHTAFEKGGKASGGPHDGGGTGSGADDGCVGVTCFG